MVVRDVLRAKNAALIAIGPGDGAIQAVDRMVTHNIGSLPVLDGDRLVGIFTERDVLRNVSIDCVALNQAQVADLMTQPVVTCGPDDDLREAMGQMSRAGVGQLPVVDSDGQTIGLISVGDIIRHLHQTVETENRHLLEYLYGPA